jgi:hypothetical protein
MLPSLFTPIISNQEHYPQVHQKAFELKRYHGYFPLANFRCILSQVVWRLPPAAGAPGFHDEALRIIRTFIAASVKVYYRCSAVVSSHEGNYESYTPKNQIICTLPNWNKTNQYTCSFLYS